MPLPAPSCPRCRVSPLRLVASGDCSDSTGGGVYTCGACGYSTARDLLVARLLGELRDAEDVVWNFARAAVPGFISDTFSRAYCPACAALQRAAAVGACDRADDTGDRSEAEHAQALDAGMFQ